MCLDRGKWHCLAHDQNYSHIRRWWAAVDSNHLPPRYQHGALPVELAAQGPAGRASSIPGIVSLLGRLIWRRLGGEAGPMAGAQGFEPWALGFGDRCSDQTELRPYRLEAGRIEF